MSVSNHFLVGMACSVASMRQRVTAVAAANRHTVVLAEGGTVYSWGSNLQGQLGYGTSDSASNAVPRIVEAMKVCSRGLSVRHLLQCGVCCTVERLAPTSMSQSRS